MTGPEEVEEAMQQQQVQEDASHDDKANKRFKSTQEDWENDQVGSKNGEKYVCHPPAISQYSPSKEYCIPLA